jgi:hypothetical protein
MRYVLPVILFAPLAPPPHAYPELPQPLPPVKGNPANKLLSVPIEDSIYDGATKCRNRRNAGITKLANWLGRTPAECSGGRTDARSGAGTAPRCTPRCGYWGAGMTKAGAKGRTSFWTAL